MQTSAATLATSLPFARPYRHDPSVEAFWLPISLDGFAYNLLVVNGNMVARIENAQGNLTSGYELYQAGIIGEVWGGPDSTFSSFDYYLC